MYVVALRNLKAFVYDIWIIASCFGARIVRLQLHVYKHIGGSKKIVSLIQCGDPDPFSLTLVELISEIKDLELRKRVVIDLALTV